GVRPFGDFSDGRVDSGPKILDHSSGERRSFNASLSNFSGFREPFEDVGDIVNPTVVEGTKLSHSASSSMLRRRPPERLEARSRDCHRGNGHADAQAPQPGCKLFRIA